MVRSILLQVTRGRQIGLGGVPPVDVPGTPLSYDIFGSSSSNDSFSTWIIIIFNEESDGVLDFPMRKREPLEDGHTSTRIVINDEKLMLSKLIKDHSGNAWDSLEIAWSDFD